MPKEYVQNTAKVSWTRAISSAVNFENVPITTFGDGFQIEVTSGPGTRSFLDQSTQEHTHFEVYTLCRIDGWDEHLAPWVVRDDPNRLWPGYHYVPLDAIITLEAQHGYETFCRVSAYKPEQGK